jgi:hypothetical protein
VLRCPACGELRIFEHSVLLNLDDVRRAREAGDGFPAVYSRCAACAAVFRRDGPDVLVAEPAGQLASEGGVVWTLPPWAPKSDDASFQMSWDVTEAFFERQAAELAWVAPLYGLVRALRTAGFDARLRAGQSLSSLGLSRAREHGLRPSQSHLFFLPQPDGRIVVDGSISGRKLRFGPVPPAFAGELRFAIEDLSRVEID